MNSSIQISYQIRYKQISQFETIGHPFEDDDLIKLNITESKTQTVIEGLKPSTKYSFYIVSLNSFGYSLPSLVLVIETRAVNQDHHNSIVKSQLGPIHSLEVFHQTNDVISIKWLPPLYIPPEASLFYQV